jgi:hypothetical protein
MTVAELLEELSKFDPRTVVLLETTTGRGRATQVDYEWDGVAEAVVINDFPTD